MSLMERHDLLLPFTQPEPLAQGEAAELARCEEAIEKGRQTFVDVGNALLRIRDERLYRATHRTFEDYCQERWDFGRRQANHLIGAAEVVQGLGTMVPKLPENERQVRALATAPPEDRAEAWRAAVESAPEGKVTAAHIRQVVQERSEPPRQQPQVPAALLGREEEQLPDDEDEVIDLVGRRLIEALAPAVQERVERALADPVERERLIAEYRPTSGAAPGFTPEDVRLRAWNDLSQVLKMETVFGHVKRLAQIPVTSEQFLSIVDEETLTDLRGYLPQAMVFLAGLQEGSLA